MDSTRIYNQVREHYSAASRGSPPQYSEAIAKSFGYSDQELANIPEGANLGLSCGNPLAIASIREGETVIDLGSGAGFDVFLASPKVGPNGRAIGVDMNDDMLNRANSIKASKGTAADNVTFVKGNITNMPLDSNTADCIISNCVINLVPAQEKPLVFKETHRLLKSGGRVAVSDILAKKELPEKMKNDLALYVGCIAGTSQLAEYEQWLKEAGFTEIVITDTKADLNAYLDIAEDGTKKSDCCIPAAEPVAKGSLSAGCSLKAASPCCSPEDKKTCCSAEDKANCCTTENEAEASCCSTVSSLRDALGKIDLNEWVGSYKIYAVKN
ncbi:S-adenosyl-L-methionine-dependent methyltransferase [Immersiella caudata]|uniref:Arsenite methyltransferase n=1 Tax=Immersiella caudata TaxID=314043 RepID=A0AA40BWX6_9PEZI|nr:S-adenosyl-L-methionine-dependent methyltransferase [Immersiella caudata]